jgi:hypothetical protein
MRRVHRFKLVHRDAFGRALLFLYIFNFPAAGEHAVLQAFPPWTGDLVQELGLLLLLHSLHFLLLLGLDGQLGRLGRRVHYHLRTLQGDFGRTVERGPGR